MNKKFFLGILLVLTTFAHADSAKSVCTLTNPNQIEMIECAAETYDEYDHQLNHIYQIKMKNLNKSNAQKLKISQRTWINQKDANCNNYTEEENGSNGPLESYECSTKMTKERIKFLKNYK